ncbi:MAG: ATP-binding protein [Rhodospirillales bacterium]|nr:MAG: ATP-binding protein [Rhodospirillales bacterium]
MRAVGAGDAPEFAGRAAELDAVRRALAPGGPVRVAITGVAGIGKSALARAIVDAIRARGGRARWLAADTGASLALGLRDAAADDTVDLHVLDDAAGPAAIAALVDAIAGPVLLTTRVAGWESSAAVVALEAPATDEATAMLRAMAHDAPPDAAGSLARCLDALPGAMHVAAAYARHAGVGFDEVERRVVAAAAAYRYMPQPAARMVGLLDIALDRACEIHADADRTMACFATMAPRPVPWPLPLPGVDGAAAGTALSTLGLIDVAGGDATMRAGFAAAARVRMKWRRLEIETIARVADALDAATKTADAGTMTALAPHLQSAFADADPRPPDVVALAAAAVRAATALRDAGFADEGQPLLAAAWTAATAWPQLIKEEMRLQIRFGAWPADPPPEAPPAAPAPRAARRAARPPRPNGDAEVDALMARALEAGAAGDQGRACADYERALALAEIRLGGDHPRIAAVLSEMSLAVAARGDPARAHELAGRSLALREAARPRVPLDIAHSRNNLGLILARGDDPAAARPLYESALRVFRRAHGADHATTATTTANLAVLLERLGERDAARRRYREAIRAYAAAGDADDPRLNRVRASYAALLMAAGDTAQAVTLAREAHGHHLRRLGAEHPWTRDSAARLADSEAAHADASAAVDAADGPRQTCGDDGERRHDGR